MNKKTTNNISRREFMKKSALGLTGLSLAGIGPGFIDRQALAAAEAPRPTFSLEPNPTVKVLRWKAFIQDELDIWLANTRRWEELTGGRVVVDSLPWEEVRPRAAMEATLGAGHDLVIGWYDDPHLYPDALVDLTDLAEYLGSQYGGWYPICRTYGRDHRTGRWLGLPIGCSGLCMNYRLGWLHEAGFEAPPSRIDEFIKCCQALKAKGHPIGLALGRGSGDPTTWTHWWLWSFGGRAVEPDGKTMAINSPETLLALEAARELFETMIPGVENWLDSDNNNAFLSGQISVTNNGSSILSAAKQNYPEVAADLVVANFPLGPVGRPTELSLLSQAFIYKHSPVPNAARHYLLFMFEAEQYSRWIGGSQGYITQSLKAFHDLPAWKNDPRIEPYRECMDRMLPNGHAGPLGKASAAAMSEFIIVDMFSEACTGKKTPANAALAAEKRLARLYSAGS
ncbi:MAG: ABC transporter substrate-binding protein [Pseudomonadota bacterium]